MKRLISLTVVFILIFSMLAACGNNEGANNAESPQEEPTIVEAVEAAQPDEESEEAEPAEEEEPAEEPAEVTEPEESGESSNSGDTWLIMLYQDADDEVLEKDIFIDLNEAEMIGSTDQVTIITQIDRMNGGYDGGGDWHSTKRFLVQQDTSGDLEELQSEELEDLGELDMGDKATLVEFATWAIENYPADKYALILSDHGAGWTGGWTDHDPNPDSQMFLHHIDEALAEIVENTGIGQLEMIGFDACLMSQIDVLAAVAPYARFAVGSEETEPALGWAYSAFLGALTENPAMDGAELSKIIVESYIDEDGRITDDAAREVLVEEVFRASNVPAEHVAKEMGSDITLTAIDLSKLGDLNDALNELVYVLVDEDQQGVAEARAYAQSYTSIFGQDSQPSFIDLGHFASILMETYGEGPVADAANQLLATIQQATVAEKHGPDRPGSTGITLYFPDGDLYQVTYNPDILAYYPQVSARFAAASLWDDFIAYHYTGGNVDPSALDTSAIAPQSKANDFSRAIDATALTRGLEVIKPGAGVVEFKDLTASVEEITLQDTLTLNAELYGKNVGYIYIYTAYYDVESDSFLTTDLDFVGSENTRTVGGVTYPDWGKENYLSFELDWQPTVWTISDGENDALAAAEAETYGATAETTFYRVWGSYQIADTSTAKDAYLRFDANGEMKSVLVFTSSGDNAAPREIFPGVGDTFTVAEEWLEFDQNPDGEYAYYAGDTVTYGENGFQMVANEAIAGDYVIGLVVEDLDGNTHEKYIEVTVTE